MASIIKDGSTYTVTWREPERADGKRTQRKKRGFTTKKAASAYVAKVTTELATNTYLAGSAQTVGSYLKDVWIPGLGVRESTKRSYAGHVHLYLVPHLGRIPLQQLSAAALRAMYTRLRTSGARGPLSASTVRGVHATIRTALSSAVNDGLIARNPAARLRLDAAERPERHFWDVEQLRSFVAASSSDRLGALYAFMAVTGVRRGEALGLRWSDVLLESDGSATVHIHQQLVDIGYRTLSFTAPKTRGSSRAVAVDSGTSNLLDAHSKTQNDEKAAWGDAYQDNGLIFAREDGTPIHPDFASKHFQYLVKSRRAPRIRLHDLRHTHASILFSLGFQPKVVSDRLGHSSVSFTLDTYTHLLPRQREGAAAAVAELVLPRMALSQ